MCPRARKFFFGLAICLALAPHSHAQESQELPPALAAPEKVYAPGEVTTPAVILYRPKVEYPRRADAGDVNGTVRLGLVLSSAGKVRDVRVVAGLSESQNRAAVRAARRIEFITAKRDGVAVSQSYEAEYAFQFVKEEEGTADDLRGVTKIFIDAGDDRRERENITGVILARLPDLKIVDAASDADAVLEFEATKRTALDTFVIKDQLGQTKQALDRATPLNVGDGRVLRRVSPAAARVALTFHEPHFNALGRRPSTNFARAFVKAFKQANGLPD